MDSTESESEASTVTGSHATPTFDPLSSREVSTMDGYRDEQGENPFDVAAEEPEEDPQAVNIHQFYPVLEHSFTKTSLTFSKEQDKRVEEAMKELVETTTTMSLLSEDSDKGFLTTSADESGSQMTTDLSREPTVLPGVLESQEEMGGDDSDVKHQGDSTGDHHELKLVKFVDSEKDDSTGVPDGGQRSVKGLTKGQNDNTCNSADSKPDGVFSTAVEEETLVKAKAKAQARQQQVVKDDWVQLQGDGASMQQIVNVQADEHFLKAMERKEKRITREQFPPLTKRWSFIPRIPYTTKSVLKSTSNSVTYSQLLFDQQLFAEALESFSRAAEMNPDNIGYHIRSIACLAALQRHGECLALVNQRLDVECGNPDLFIMRARLHEMFRNTTLSYYDIKDALALDPDHMEAMNMMQKLEQRAEENKHNAQQLKTNPAVADFHVIRGTIHRKLSDFNAAIDDFLLALDKCEHNEESAVYMDAQRQLLLTYNDFAVECFNKGFYDEALFCSIKP
ncbi:hypothetical protein ScPMuIL_011261 [Solemya velum]